MHFKEKIDFRVIRYGSEEYAQALALRDEVLRKPLGLSFTAEQLAQEGEQIHIGGFLGEELCATAALVPEGSEVKMRQVAIREDLQSKGIGSQLMDFCEEVARGKGYASITCHARESAVPFYLKNGYVVEGEPFVEVGIPHRKMRKLL